MSETSSGATVELALAGMHCGSCVALIEETLEETAGVQSVSVTLEPPRAELSFDATEVSLDDIIATVAGLGYSASLSGESRPKT